jgi:hypothetical protein
MCQAYCVGGDLCGKMHRAGEWFSAVVGSDSGQAL